MRPRRWILLVALIAGPNAGCDQLAAYLSGDRTRIDVGDTAVGDTTRDGDVGAGDGPRDGDVGPGDGPRDATADQAVDRIGEGRDLRIVEATLVNDGVGDATPIVGCSPPASFLQLASKEAAAIAVDSAGKPYVFWAQAAGSLVFRVGSRNAWSPTQPTGQAADKSTTVAAASDATTVYALYGSNDADGIVSVAPSKTPQAVMLPLSSKPGTRHVALADNTNLAAGVILRRTVSGTEATVLSLAGGSPTTCPSPLLLTSTTELYPAAALANNGGIAFSYYDQIGGINHVRHQQLLPSCGLYGSASAVVGNGHIALAARQSYIEAMHALGTNNPVLRDTLAQGSTFPNTLSFGTSGLSGMPYHDAIALAGDELGNVIAVRSVGPKLSVVKLTPSGSWGSETFVTGLQSTTVQLRVKARSSRAHVLVIDATTSTAQYYCVAY